MSEFKRVMCVEDDADILKILEFSLKRIGGLDVLLFERGQPALDAVPTFRPDLVVLDVMMPEMTGPETLAAMRLMPEMAGVPVVFMTAKAMPEEVEDLLQYGATGVIVKPFDPVTLPGHLRIYWEHGHGEQQPR